MAEQTVHFRYTHVYSFYNQGQIGKMDGNNIPQNSPCSLKKLFQFFLEKMKKAEVEAGRE